MISIVMAPNLKKYVPIENIFKKLYFSYNSSAVNWHLTNMNFDHRHTKPINLTGMDILKILYWSELEIFISSYSQNFLKWKFSPVNAYKPKDKKDWIFLNIRQLKKRSPNEWENTIWHELVHIADHISNNTFDHGDNELNGDENTAPVKFAKFMSNLITN